MDWDEVSAEWVSRFRRNVRRWYSRCGRDLPWVGERDPYVVWVREIMLQQTTVKAVVPYLDRFLERFPTVESLASAEVADVLRVWEGLGYYSRARNLGLAAKMIVGEWGGQWRETAKELQTLPGVGPYTAGAIASFAFGQSAAIVEANTARFYARLLALTDDLHSGEGRRQLWSLAERIVPRDRPGEFNQALIDLGATVCGVTPQCQECPVRRSCRSLELGEVERIPVRASRQKMTDVFEVLVVIRRGHHLLLIQHPEGKRWGGMWGFPALSREKDQAKDGIDERMVESQVADWGCDVECDEWLEEIRHTVTRFRLHLQPVIATWRSGCWAGPVDAEWMAVDDLASVPLSVAERRVAKRVEHIMRQNEASM